MRPLVLLPSLLLVWLLFAFASAELRVSPRLDAEDVLRVRLPIPVQLAYAGGDRFLAANLNVFRSLMVDARITESETYRVQGQLQADASFFNPRHEDNYYVGAAILPWNGQVETAQLVLLRAAESRGWDMWPAFYYAFNAMYFEHDMQRAGHWAEVAAERNPANAATLRDIAAKWYERGDDPRLALGILKAMYEQSRDENFRLLLQARIMRLEGLQALRAAAAAYVAEHAAPAPSLEALQGYGGLQAVPQDPLQLGYALSAAGEPVLVDHVLTEK